MSSRVHNSPSVLHWNFGIGFSLPAPQIPPPRPLDRCVTSSGHVYACSITADSSALKGNLCGTDTCFQFPRQSRSGHTSSNMVSLTQPIWTWKKHIMHQLRMPVFEPGTPRMNDSSTATFCVFHICLTFSAQPEFQPFWMGFIINLFRSCSRMLG